MDPEGNGVISHLKEFNFDNEFLIEGRASRLKLTRSQKCQTWHSSGRKLVWTCPLLNFKLQQSNTYVRKRGGRKSCFK